MNGTAQDKTNYIYKSEETQQLVCSFFSILVLVLITGEISKLTLVISFECFFPTETVLVLFFQAHIFRSNKHSENFPKVKKH